MRAKLGMLSIIVLVCSAIGVWHFGYKYYWWIYYPSLRHTIGGPEVTTAKAHLWTCGIWVTAVLAVLSLSGIVKFFVEQHQQA